MIDFGLLYDKNVDNLFAFGSRFTADRELIKDCIHDVFVKVFIKQSTLDKVENIESYLYISLRNRLNDEFRKNGRICDSEINDQSMRMVAENEEFLLQRKQRQEELTASVEKGFKMLSPRQRQIIHLYYTDQRKYDEICSIMGINYQSVRNLMHKSIRRLRDYANNNAAVL